MPLDPLFEKCLAGARLTPEDAVALYRHPDVNMVGRLAHRDRVTRHGLNATYIVNRHINPTNLCVEACNFCAFAKTKRSPDGYAYAMDEVLARADEAVAAGACEVHVVGGLHPDWEFEHYLDFVREIKQRHPALHVKAFTAVEIDWFTQLTGESVQSVLQACMQAGVDSLPGGGAEIFAPGVRSKICDHKTDADRWIEVHRVAHALGLRSTCTMLYGHIESIEDRVDHMLRLRELQDETGGFTTFIPLNFHPENTRLDMIRQASGLDDLRTIAVARLFLDNIDHVKTYWIMTGVFTAQVALRFGADDIDGTVVEEKITHMAGAVTPEHLAEADLRRIISEAGFAPVRRDTFYQPVAAAGSAD